MVKYDPKEWFTIIIKFPKADTFQKLLPLMIYIGIYTAIVAWAEMNYFKLSENSYLKNTTSFHTLLGFALSMLLVFRTNTAYERWWEGRRLWGSLVNNSRSLALKLNHILDSNDTENRQFFKALMSNQPYIIKNHLRKVWIDSEWEETPTVSVVDMKTHSHLPNHLLNLLHQRLQLLHSQHKLTTEHLLYINTELQCFTDVCGACERIRNTPIPFSYSSFLKKFIFFFVMTLPFGYVFSLKWITIFFVPFVFYVLASLELIAEEIENPFGKDANDLPLDEMSRNIRKNVHDLILIPQNQEHA